MAMHRKSSSFSTINTDPKMSDFVKDLLKGPLQDLNRALSKPESQEDGPFGIFSDWAVSMAESSYTGIGQIAWQAPAFFVCKQNAKEYKAFGQRGGGSAGKKEGLSLEESSQVFCVSGLQESAYRGNQAEALLDSMFRILNSRLEENGKRTMFIISGYNFENLLSWIRKPQNIETYFGKSFPKILEQNFIDSKGLEKLCKLRGDMDQMVLHPEKGILLIEIKSINRDKVDQQTKERKSEKCTNTTDDKVLEKLEDAGKQLLRNRDVLFKVMEKSKYWGERLQVTEVIAVPCLSRNDLDELRVRERIREEIQFICKEEMMQETEDSLKVSEAESNIKELENWWTKLPDDPLSLSCIKEIVGKYVGPLSSVVCPKKGYPNQIPFTYVECIRQVSMLSRRLLLTREQTEIIESRTKGQKRVYISGPPGSGKTLLLMFRSIDFLNESGKNHVIVVNMYRGANGRAIGQKIFGLIRDTSSKSDSKERVKILDLDLHKNQFVQKVNDLFPGGTAGASSKTSSEPKAAHSATKTGQHGGARPKTLSTPTKGHPKHILFIVDEIYKELYWPDILETFNSEFEESEVWCAGLFSTVPEGFAEHRLTAVVRCPPATQNLLYHVDWDQERKKNYRRNMWPEVASNGPVPLCIRHQCHADHGVDCVLKCAACGRQLASLLKMKRLVDKHVVRGGSAPPFVKTSHRGLDDPLKVTILVNLPRRLYQKDDVDSSQQDDVYIVSTVDDYRQYMKEVKGSPFISALQEDDIQVAVKEILGDKTLEGQGATTAVAGPVEVTWLYNFQGLETDAVVFLPGDPSSSPAAECGDTPPNITKREIPAPGLKQSMAQQQGQEQASGMTTSKEESLASSGGAEGAGQPLTRSTARAEGKDSLSDQHLMWRVQDVQRFSPWDKINILVAGSRTLSLLILIVP